jgi:hypothetical protein
MDEYRQGELFNPRDFSMRQHPSRKQRPYGEEPPHDAYRDYQHSKPIKEYAHELGMIKDLITAVMNRIDAIEEMVSMQTEMLEDLTDTLLDP